MGEFGATEMIERYLPFLHDISALVLWRLFYTPVWQQILSLAGYCTTLFYDTLTFNRE
jgi:hypothetical protein